jgi:hypothetical protein
MGALVELEARRHHPAARDQYAETRAFVAVITGTGDAQEKGFVLGFDRLPIYELLQQKPFDLRC